MTCEAEIKLKAFKKRKKENKITFEDGVPGENAACRLGCAPDVFTGVPAVATELEPCFEGVNVNDRELDDGGRFAFEFEPSWASSSVVKLAEDVECFTRVALYFS